MLRGGKGGNATSVSENYSPEGLRNVRTLRQLCQQLSSEGLRAQGQKENRSKARVDPPGEEHEMTPPHVSLTSENIGLPRRLDAQKSGSGVQNHLLTQFPLFLLCPGLGICMLERLCGNSGRNFDLG